MLGKEFLLEEITTSLGVILRVPVSASHGGGSVYYTQPPHGPCHLRVPRELEDTLQQNCLGSFLQNKLVAPLEKE